MSESTQEKTSSALGTHVWYELMTTDTVAAAEFYTDIMGWAAKDAGMTGIAYTLFSTNGTEIAGLMELPPPEAGAPPCWMGLISVDDVDGYAQRVRDAGGAVYRPAEDIPGVGRFAVVADPQGAAFMLFKGADESPDAKVPPAGGPGYFGWHELRARDWESAFAFYSGLFGWTRAGAIDMGSMGTYLMFADAHGQPVGGMMNAPDAPPHWLYYVNVESIEAATARVKAKGGAVLYGPAEVPGGSWTAQCQDPQGVHFAIVGPRG